MIQNTSSKFKLVKFLQLFIRNNKLSIYEHFEHAQNCALHEIRTLVLICQHWEGVCLMNDYFIFQQIIIGIGFNKLNSKSPIMAGAQGEEGARRMCPLIKSQEGVCGGRHSQRGPAKCFDLRIISLILICFNMT